MSSSSSSSSEPVISFQYYTDFVASNLYNAEVDPYFPYSTRMVLSIFISTLGFIWGIMNYFPDNQGGPLRGLMQSMMVFAVMFYICYNIVFCGVV